MTLCELLLRLVQLLHCRRSIVRVRFAHPHPNQEFCAMSNVVNLNASSSGVQSVDAVATATIGGQPAALEFTWASSDTSVATVTQPVTGSSTATVTAVADPAGPSTRTCAITATASDGGSGFGTATVITSAAGVSTVTVDFGTPTP